ncbi:MAG TPA: TlpA disulfide reductase family protein, partial [Acidobacteriota bacterium]|nr:TlpA disulfide reductase family protein [Acidobacteriota bacterium]
QERAYNLEEFAAAANLTNPGEAMPAKVGALAPAFETSTMDGATVRLSDFRDKKHVVIMTGAVTSPMCVFEMPAMNQLQGDFADQPIVFFLLYTRESHPAENFAAHTDFEMKRAYARALQKLEDVRFPIIVDHLDGRIHQAYGVWPNGLFIIHKDGRLVFRSNMANHRELRQFLDDLVAADKAAAAGKVLHLQYSERIIAHEADQATHRRIYERAGPKAFEDYWAKRPQNRNRWP